MKFVVGFGPGGANDIVARIVAEGVSKQLGQPVIVENKPGAGSVLGADFVAKSPSDGYTFFVSAGGIITNPMIKKSMPYKEGDLVPVALLAVSPSIIVVPPDSTIKNLRDLIARAKDAKGIQFSTAGTGSTPHFVAEMLKVNAGGKYDIIPYKSGSEAKVAVLSNQVDATSESSAVTIPQIQGGKLRAIASTWNKRIEALPNVPTTKEEGYPQILIGHWAGLFAPKGTPNEILDKMNKAVEAALKSSEVQKRLVPQGIEPTPGSRASFVNFLNDERNRLAPIVQRANMRDD
ncbi:MAG: tripartite tricarboxylate transporter substrate binding protein [Burkholderiaceae bacterium]|nr:tripartite tricarboxylate transporter substrate binding protein [Burkholderiaceae bacterium]NCA08474.1 tripartite tricarboxylate transporter substrate binding protein [Burkholderiaceae bacterium]NCU94222.1 tripartite tricarboxylate transporter substrate binding protein [Burkholderiaceae bacterium]NCV72373.1 tripartite tricarboxylate transporter substrate binding protein [Burkholderiaceae bacterium]NCX26870.1 tripartite tricarboxylate transporter substrate binding protein [Burkholderiaceae ba